MRFIIIRRRYQLYDTYCFQPWQGKNGHYPEVTWSLIIDDCFGGNFAFRPHHFTLAMSWTRPLRDPWREEFKELIAFNNFIWRSNKATKGVEKTNQLHAVVKVCMDWYGTFELWRLNWLMIYIYICIYIYPIGSMYGIFTNFYHKHHLNVGKYTIHGSYGIYIYKYIISSDFVQGPKSATLGSLDHSSPPLLLEGILRNPAESGQNLTFCPDKMVEELNTFCLCWLWHLFMGYIILRLCVVMIFYTYVGDTCHKNMYLCVYIHRIPMSTVYDRSDTFYRPFFLMCTSYWLSQWLTFRLLRLIYLVGNMKLKLLSHGPLAE